MSDYVISCGHHTITQEQSIKKAQNHVFFLYRSKCPCFYLFPSNSNVIQILKCEHVFNVNLRPVALLRQKCNWETAIADPNASMHLITSEARNPEWAASIGDARQRRNLPLLVYCHWLFQSMCHTYYPSQFSTVTACPAGFYFALRVLDRVRVRTGYYAAHNCTSSCCRLSQ